VIAGYRSVDAGKLDGLMGQLGALAQSDRPFHASVIELQALAAARKGDLARARELWTSLLKDSGAPQGVQQRAQGMLSLHGPAESK
jgi:hypothetical protein